jgi:hypothetical protein
MRTTMNWTTKGVAALATGITLFCGMGTVTAMALTSHHTTAPPAAAATATPHPVPAKTIIRTVPGPVRTKYVTRPSRYTCFSYDGRAYLSSPGTGIPAVNGCTITVAPVYPLSSGESQLTVTAPDGSTGSYIANWNGPAPSAAPSEYAPLSGDPVPGSGTGSACTTVAGMFPGGEPGHDDSTGFCVPDK